jgi:hypothetical protein
VLQALPLLFAPPPPLDFFSPLKKPQACAFVCVASSLFFGRWGLTRTNRKLIFIEKKKNHGWRTRMFQLRWMCVVFLCRRCSCRRRVPRVQTQHVPTPSPLSPPFLFFSFLVRAWCGADGDRVFFSYIAYLSTAQSKKKFIVPKNIASSCASYLPRC